MQDQDTTGDDVVRVPLYAKDGTIVAYAVIDADAAPLIGAAPWRLGTKGYARRNTGNRLRGTAITLYLHRVVLGLPPRSDGRLVDHIDRDPLNCRRKNMRIIPNGANRQNLSSYQGSRSRYRGVYWNSRAQCWDAQITRDGRHTHVGSFASEDAAGEAARAARLLVMPYAVD